MNIDEILQGAGNEPVAVAPTGRRFTLARGRSAQPVVAGWPKVSLLPPEIRGEAQQRSIRRAMVGGVVAVALLVVGGVAGANALASSSHEHLDAQTAELTGLQAKVAKFGDVRQLQAQIDLAEAAQRVGSSTSIDWQAQVGEIENLMPTGFSTTGVTIDSATPIADYPQSSSPLEGTRVATVVLTAATDDITELPRWLRELPALEDIADVTPTVTGSDDAGYTVVLTIHLNEKAYVTPLKEAAK